MATLNLLSFLPTFLFSLRHTLLLLHFNRVHVPRPHDFQLMETSSSTSSSSSPLPPQPPIFPLPQTPHPISHRLQPPRPHCCHLTKLPSCAFFTAGLSPHKWPMVLWPSYSGATAMVCCRLRGRLGLCCERGWVPLQTGRCALNGGVGLEEESMEVGKESGA